MPKAQYRLRYDTDPIIGGTLVVAFTEISILAFREMQNIYLKYCAPHKGLDKTYYLAI